MIFLKHESNISYLNSTTFPRHIFHITLTKRFDAQISVFISQFLRHCKLEQILANDLKMRKKKITLILNATCFENNPVLCICYLNWNFDFQYIEIFVSWCILLNNYKTHVIICNLLIVLCLFVFMIIFKQFSGLVAMESSFFCMP